MWIQTRNIAQNCNQLRQTILKMYDVPKNRIFSEYSGKFISSFDYLKKGEKILCTNSLSQFLPSIFFFCFFFYKTTHNVFYSLISNKVRNIGKILDLLLFHEQNI